MSLKDQLQADLKMAMLNRDETRKTALRILIAELKNTEVAKQAKLAQERAHLWVRPGEFDEEGNALIDAKERDRQLAEIAKLVPLSDAEIQNLLATEIKRRRDAIAELETAHRPELLQEATAQLNVLLVYLPRQMSREEIETAAKQAIAELGVSGPQAMGAVMGQLMPRLKGKADGKLINEVVRELLK
jgi:uncharacterized protein YqeY